MKQNKYDDAHFFAEYEQMPRSVHGLAAAGEWPAFQTLLPQLRDMAVLDLGCGYGWHCRYACEQQARSVVGVDISVKMLQRARELTEDPSISYIHAAIEDIDFPESSFDVVLSSLAFHYLESFAAVCGKVSACLKPGGTFVFSVEHPIFTSRSEQDWHFDDQGNRLHWPVDRYQQEGLRETCFLTENVLKYHRTLSTYMNDLIAAGFRIEAVSEPVPTADMLERVPGMTDELRRPMFLIISAMKATALLNS